MKKIYRSSKIFFFFQDRGLALSHRSLLKSFIEQLFIDENKKPRQINYIFCDNNYMLKLNLQYLNHNYFTDILTFPLEECNGAISADIFINIDEVRKNAKEYGNSLREEIHRVIFHGALHLCGYKDKTDKEKRLMRKKEDHYLSLYLK